jgi:hypothetical protein
MIKYIPALCALLISAMIASAAPGDNAKVSDLAEHALKQSQLTLPGSRPFHLQATLVETTNPKSEYQAKIEEFWLSPTKWRRTIESPGFSQTLIVDGDRVSEKNVGDYFPWWLSEFVTAMFDPIPMLDRLKQSNSEMPKLGTGGAMPTCSDLRTRTDRWVICFEGNHGLLDSIFMKGYGAEFKDYKKFGDKHVARTIENDPEPGTHLQAKITELSELTRPDEQSFAVTESTPPEGRLKTIRIDEDAVRNLAVNSTEIDWPTVGEGLTTGGCAVYISADRKGRVREVWPSGCDNAGLQDPLRDQVKQWKLKPPVSNGSPVQIHSLVTFTFHAGQDKSKALPQLSDADARKLAFYTVDPIFPPGTSGKLKEVIVNISVDQTGKFTGGGPALEMPNDVFFAALKAVSQWRFNPYMLNGKPQYFHATVTFPVK